MRIHAPLLSLGLTAILGFAACNGGGDDDDTDDVTPMGVKIDAFTASKNSVAAGAMVVLSYQVSNATSVSISATPGGSLLQESTNFMGTVTSAAINEATTFTLTANGMGGPKMATVMVTIDQNAVEVLTFSATPNPAAAGDMVRLAWTTAGATQVRVLEGTMELHNTTTDVASGSFMVTVDDMSHTYRVEASNASATDTAEVTVTIAEPGRVRFFKASPTIYNGATGSIQVVWNGTGEEFLLTANGNAVPEFTGTNTGTITVSASGPTIYQFSAMGAGDIDTAFVGVAPSGGMEAEPNNDVATANPVNGAITGMVMPMDDLDFFSFTVPAGGNVFAETTDGMGACAFDTEIRLYDSNGDELGSNDQDGPGDCSQINPAYDFFARDLAAGTYYINVESWNGGFTGNYGLVVIPQAGRCGNGIVETSLSEQCDDGNTTAGDGCSATCQVQVLGTVTGIGQDQTFDETIDPSNQIDFYEIVLSEPGFIFAETGAPTVGLCEGGADTILELFDSTFVELTQNDDIDLFGDPPNFCSRINPAEDPLAGVPAGTYYLGVRTYSQVLPYQLQIRTIAAGCGNGIPEPPTEQCDDGGTVAGDRCSPTCTLETFGTINPPGGMVTVPATSDPMVLPAFVEIVIGTAGQSITATTTDGAGGCPFSTRLGLFGSDLRRLGLAFGDGGCASIDPFSATAGQNWAANLEPGSYLLGVIAETPGDMGNVTVEVNITNPQCGNGLTETRANEQCDDRNTANGDGCNSTCRFEGNIMVESEPNNDGPTADTSGAALNMTVTLNGDIDPAGDADWWAVTVPAGATLIARTYPLFNDPASCDRIKDTRLYLLDSAGMELASNDDDETRDGFCSAIDGTLMDPVDQTLVFPMAANMAAGTYYVRVQAFDTTQTFTSYFLEIRLQ